VAFLAECFVTLLRQVAAEPDRPFGELSILSPSWRARTVAQGHLRPATPRVAFGSIERSIPSCFAETVRRHPERIAVHTVGTALTYRMLDQAARRVAAAILDLPLSPRIALLLPHDETMVVGIMGVLLAARTYVPLHPSHPIDRLKFILDDTSASIIVCSGEVRRLAGELATEGRRVVALDDLPPVAERDLPQVSADAIAYLIYTSGSTGRPKGVIQSHRNVLHFIRRY